jgi:ketosteroid isomerase-like protein
MKSIELEIIRKAEQTLAKAHLEMDITTIAALLHEDYIIMQPGGRIETKAEVLESYQTGNRHWDRAEAAELDVNLYGDMARVLGLWIAAGTNLGIPFDYQARFVSIWIKENDQWRNISYSSSEITGQVKYDTYRNDEGGVLW